MGILRITCSFILFYAVIAIASNMRSSLMKKFCSVSISIGLAIYQPFPSLAEIVVTRIPLVESNDFGAITGAIEASQQPKLKSLSSSEFKKAKAGIIPLSQEPRAVKRRITAACKNNEILQLIKPEPITSYECMTRVMNGEDTSFINNVLKDLPVDKVQPLVKSYGSPP